MTLKFNGFKAKRNFHTILNFVLFQKYKMYESKYRTKICDFKFSFLFFFCFSRVTICTLALPTLAFDRAILLAHGPMIGNFTCAL